MKSYADGGGCLSCTKAQIHVNSRTWKKSRSYMEIPAATATIDHYTEISPSYHKISKQCLKKQLVRVSCKSSC